MKKGILALAAGIGLLAGGFLSYHRKYSASNNNDLNSVVGSLKDAHSEYKEFNKVVESLKDCAYSSYKNQENPSLIRKLKKRGACFKLNRVMRKKGISSLEDYFEKNGLFYVHSKSYLYGERSSYYAANIIKKFEKDGIPVYLTRLGKGVKSFDNFMHGVPYVNTLTYNNGTKKIVIDIEVMEKDSLKAERAWSGYKSNHDALVSGDLVKGNPIFEPVYIALKDHKENIEIAYQEEKLTSSLAHEMEHVLGKHAVTNDPYSEKIAISAAVETSPVGLTEIQQFASKGHEDEIAVFKCLMGTEDIFNTAKQAEFYLQGKNYIQQRGAYCKQEFIRQRQNR